MTDYQLSSWAKAAVGTEWAKGRLIISAVVTVLVGQHRLHVAVIKWVKGSCQ